MAGSRELFQRAYKLSDLGKFEEAEACYREVLKLDPTYSMAWNNLGWILFDQKDIVDEAELCYKNALRYDPNNYIALNNLGIIYYRRKKDYHGAEKLWKKVVKINPYFMESWKNLSVLYKFQIVNLKRSQECEKKANDIIAMQAKKSNLQNKDPKIEEKLNICIECGNRLEPEQIICDKCGGSSKNSSN